jgi:GTPase SAR1 family protein
MGTYNALKGELIKINQQMSSLLSSAKAITGMDEHPFGDWERTCDDFQKQISEEIIRVAVVGAIKSGKSTLVNALFKGDHLRRGAGVITSIVTRVQSGNLLKAELDFKSWHEVNSDIEQAMVLFPSTDWRSENKSFDICREKERLELQQALNTLNTDQLITNDTRNANSVLLAAYLKGYDRVREIISSDTTSIQYEKDLFPEHQSFVGDESLSVYLNNIKLQIDSSAIDGHYEIADCQGSDSPNPLHLAMIQDYLLLTHFIVYVVSSRTGLRQADIKFLSIIKKMGILDNIVFVVNCDLGEHESLDNLSALVERVKEEVSLIKPNPEIYCFSALYNLFKSMNDNLTAKDKQKLRQWKSDRELTAFMDQEAENFKSSLDHKLTRERNSLLLKNHLERFGVILSGLDHWAGINQDILLRDTSSVNEIITKLKHHQEKMAQINSIIQRTLNGAIQSLKKELAADIDRFFDARSGQIVVDIVEFIRNYNVTYSRYEESIIASGFSNTLYSVFQEVKQALDTFLTETINPEIVGFVKRKEARIKEYLESVVSPFDNMIQDAIMEHNDALSNVGISRLMESRQKVELPDIDFIKGAVALALPPLAANMRYSAKIRTEAIMRLGFYAAVKMLKKILKKPIQIKNEEEIQALKDGVNRMKRETERSVIFLFKDYKENIKFQYFFKIADAASSRLIETLLDRFQAYGTDFSTIEGIIKQEQIDKERTSQILKEMELTAGSINERVDAIKEKISLTI